ncbi:MAG: hypothetical protein ACOYLH_00605 [Flavobacteriales bacterium]
MKKSIKIFSFFFSAALLIACAGEESEQLKQARTIQEGMMKQKQMLDSSINLKMEELGAQVTTMSQDTTLSTDSTKIAQYVEIKTQLSKVEEMKSKLSDWQNNLKLLPSLEDLAKGVESPFGKDAKDQDILKAIQDNQASFQEIKSEVETAIQ